MTDFTEQHKRILRYLFSQSYQYGFGFHPLKPIADELSLRDIDIYNPSENTGLFQEYSQEGNGFLDFQNSLNMGVLAAINFDVKDLLENWSR